MGAGYSPKRAWQSFSQLFAAFSDCWGSDRETAGPVGLSVPQEEAWEMLHAAHLDALENETHHLSSEARGRPGLPSVQILFLFQKPLFQQTLTWNLIP